MAIESTKTRGEFYDLIKKIGVTHWEPEDLIDKITRIGGWNITEYNDSDLCISIHEYASILPFNDFLNDIEIKHKDILVYKAKVHRYDSSIHQIEVFQKDNDWQKSLLTLLDSYL